MEETKKRFLSIGLVEKEVEKILKNSSLTQTLTQVLDSANIKEGCEKSIGLMLYKVATFKFPKIPQVEERRIFVASYIGNGKIKTSPQLNEALNYLKKLGTGELKNELFEEICGVGVTITDEDVTKTVKEIISNMKPENLTLKSILAETRAKLKWAEPKVVKDEVDKQLLELQKLKDFELSSNKNLKKRDRFPRPEENTTNDPKILEKHLKETGGKVVTRFPPEPNGYLHIGHAKAMTLDFGYAEQNDGICYLRFDDTNPTAEKQEYIDGIIENVKWFGFKIYKITYSSSYFDQLYEFAIQLIKDDLAYVCHQTPKEMSQGREDMIDSPWRNRPIEESLAEFEKMKKGFYKEGEAVLRLKMNMKSENPCLRDLVAYRVKFMSHPRTGDKWCIYPSYDFTHCIVDSLENITHSLCTLEFQIRQESYYWLLDALRIYKPVVWEFGRLNLSHTIMSKRKLQQLIRENYVIGWSDPRMPTINGLRRRGYTATAIKQFCEIVGVSRKDESLIPIELLESVLIKELDKTCPRAFAILDPLKITLTNFEKFIEFEAPNHPKNPSFGKRKIPLTKVIYIEKSDFRMNDSEDFYGLSLNKEVGLKYGINITCTKVITDKDGKVIELEAEGDFKKERKPKGYIHWISPDQNEKLFTAEVHVYDHLLICEDPSTVDDWLAQINPNSLLVINDALIDPVLVNSKPGDKFQFERLGFFCVDSDSNDSKLIFNKTVPLKGKKDF
ncbi:glutamine--tRNA ligase [Anaeramoeba ignava]|uniref:glutamine--tRNA ligase n=1 Tax=Anaeramoeba ignava TaxID=1746090 RepID=A0A9Q0RE09_ANAIG|nr:glutamine--tRNA ligase [Anaeramoeba ignava]